MTHRGLSFAWIAAGLFLICAASSGFAQRPYDELLERLRPQGMVSDFAGVLKPSERETLEQKLRQLRRETGSEVAVVILKSLEGGQIDDFANKLFARFGIGGKEKDTGALLLVALEDRKSRIETGYGLEPILPDALAGRILDEQLRPAFRQERYAEGLTAAVDRMADIIRRGEPAEVGRDKAGLAKEWPVMVTVFLGIFVAIGAFLFGAGVGARDWSSAIFGLCFGGLPVLVAFAVGLVAVGVLAALGTAIALWGFRYGRAYPRTFRRGTSGGRRRPWTWDSGWGGWSAGTDWGGFGGDGGGGGGFSFGGGSSGGGGASGSW